ncbi:(2Fe-2S)-binding protein [Aeromicrobium ginsengisoli]|uniref:(2Fe-2S)-binding protein n=1 Tax=Aeromicrobium ginsengisoli TaxID=363867 RepID=A0A5M4FAI3_9ACTN|nr:(2Fe-2S)-binding protein [Aeromicrobium ginsengisoli]KAA1395393.1 (2Fe-2S)-binding protein [Aeromicrobium ginsengisoli]
MTTGPDDAALDLAAEVGPFFVLDRWAPDAGWRPLRELTESDVIAGRVAAAREMLAERSRVAVAEIEERATASIVFLGLAARLVSPAFASAVLAERVPHLLLDELWWRPVVGGPWPLARSSVGESTAGELAEDLDARILQPIVAPVLDAFGRTYAVSPQVLWGNVASSLAGALTMLRAARPDRAEAATQLVGQLLDHGTLAGTGDLDPAGPSFVRRSCCLFYRVPGAGICGDCVLDEAPKPA